ncbi:MAG: hypothetical protein ABF380_12930 [Akkermansiaceae bacterium]
MTLRKKMLIWGALAGIPLCVWAITDDFGYFWQYSSVGWNADQYGLTGNPDAFHLVGYVNDPGGHYAVAAVGQGLISPTPNSLVVGINNEVSSAPTSEQPLFTVANGASSWMPNNVFEVRQDGTVIMTERQGDVLMGGYSN